MSQKIPSSQRDELRNRLQALTQAEGGGFILRTNGEDAADTEAYFALARRHLAPAGRIWGTWFLMDADARAAVARGETTLGFILRDDAPTFHLGEGQSPSYAVAYDFDFACAAYARHGFEIELIQKGHWCNRSHKTGGGYQDLIVARMG